MTPIARADRYAGQDFPCYGAQPVVWGLETRFKPWFFDGMVVWWGPPCESRSEAVAAAAEMVACRQGGGLSSRGGDVDRAGRGSVKDCDDASC